MNTKNSRQKPVNAGSEEALSPLETLLSGKAGPLPLDNDLKMQPGGGEDTSNVMRFSAREKTSGPYLNGVKGRIIKAYPDLTEDKLNRMLAET